jgi:predicted PurR-regulated permease PerM
LDSKTEAARVSQAVFYGSLLLIGYLAYQMLRPFLVEIGWAVVLAIVLEPARVRLVGRMGPTRSAGLLTVLVVVLLVIPVAFVGTALVKEGGPAVAYLEGQLENRGGPARFLHDGWDWLQTRVPVLPPEQEVISRVTESVGNIASFVASRAGFLLKGVAGFLFSLVITLAVLFFMLRDAPVFAAGLRRVLPFGRERNERLLVLAQDLVSASVTATLTIAALQGLIGGLAFFALGIEGAVLWGVMMGLLALLPLVGATLVWLPAAVWLVLSGSVVSGVVLALVGVLVLSNVDNVVRPLLLSGSARMNTLVLILSLLGGVSAFGFIGIVLGPLVAAILTALVGSYQPGGDEDAAGPGGSEGASGEARAQTGGGGEG